MSADLEQLIEKFEAALRGRPDYPLRLAGLARTVAKKGDKSRAFDLARKALALADGDPRAQSEARAALRSLIPGYHVPMMNDARRNAAWDQALRRAIRPGMHVFEIGTGAGMLAMMAARAGAGHVTTCENHPVVAALARELVARNGLADRVTVLTKTSQQVLIGNDMARPADLLFCDIFADTLVGFDPLVAIADAKARLLTPDAATVPRAVSLQVALVHWRHHARTSHIDAAAGFDLSAMADFAQATKVLPIGDRDLTLLSEGRQAFRFDLARPSHPAAGTFETACEADAAGEANGVASWIRLELDEDTVLEAKPEPGAVFFSSAVYHPFAAPLQLAAGETVRIGTSHEGDRINAWLA